MSKSRTTTMSTLLRKREQLERQIATAQAAEKRKSQILASPEFATILHVDDAVLRAGFTRIAQENPSG